MYKNHDVPTGQSSDSHFLFRALYAHFLSYGFVIYEHLANPFEQIVLRTCPGSTRFLPYSFWWNFCKLCVLYFFLYFNQLLSLIAVIFIFYLLVIFRSQTRIRVNIKVVRCLEYGASLFPTQSVLRRNSDNNNHCISYNSERIRHANHSCS